MSLYGQMPVLGLLLSAYILPQNIFGRTVLDRWRGRKSAAEDVILKGDELKGGLESDPANTDEIQGG
jgi:hypothetical protein